MHKPYGDGTDLLLFRRFPGKESQHRGRLAFFFLVCFRRSSIHYLDSMGWAGPRRSGRTAGPSWSHRRHTHWDTARTPARLGHSTRRRWHRNPVAMLSPHRTSHTWSNRGRFVDWPHSHGDAPVWLNHPFPNRGQYDLAIGADQIIMTLLHMRAQHIYLQEGLLDKVLHSL